MKKDIAKIPTDLNSRSQEEQLVNLSETKNSFRRWWVQKVLAIFVEQQAHKNLLNHITVICEYGRSEGMYYEKSKSKKVS